MRAQIHKLTLVILFLFPCLLLSSQWDHTQWGSVPPEDLTMQVYPADSSAEAVVLSDCGFLMMISGSPSVGPKYILRRHRRIKLLKRSAFEKHGRVKLFFIHDREREQIENLKAQTILPNGRRHEVSSKDMFKTKENKWASSISFAFPDLEEGAVIEYQYQLTSGDVIEPRTWYFQEDIPVRYNSLLIQNESRISYVSLFNGNQNFSEKEQVDDAIIYRKGDMQLSYGEELIVLENAPAMVEEEFMTTLEDYRIKIRLQGEAFHRLDGHREQLFTTWGKSAESLLEHEQFGLQFRRKKNFKKVLDGVKSNISADMTPQQISEVILDFVSENVEYNGRESFWVRNNLNRAFIEKTANAGEINLMCLALLKAYDIKAFPILTSTRDHGKMYRHYPLIDQFNYVLVGVKLDEKILLLDATDPLYTLNMPSPNALNKYGWVVDVDEPTWIDIKVPICRDIYGSEILIDEEGNVGVKLRAVFNSYTALVEQDLYENDQSGEYWKERIERFANEVKFDSINGKKLNRKTGKFMNEVAFSVPNGAMVAGDFLYVSPILYSNFEETPFSLKERQYPVDFPYPFEERYVVSVLIPDGYKVEELPAAAHLLLPEKKGSFDYRVDQTEQKVQIMLSLILSNTTFEPANYSELKAMFDLMISKRAEQIVFKKISEE